MHQRLKKIELINILNKKNSKVVGNTYKFEQVILNLLLNAKKEPVLVFQFHSGSSKK